MFIQSGPKRDKTYKKIREFSDLLIKKTLELNGTITGEYGIGLHKKEYLLKEHGDNIPVMKLIKRSIDQKETAELAVMVDTFKPLKLTKQALDIEIKKYYKSWIH